jgi:hypothetical protein
VIISVRKKRERRREERERGGRDKATILDIVL